MGFQVKDENFGLADTGDYCFQQSITDGIVSLTNYKEESSETVNEICKKLNQYPIMMKALRYAWNCLDDNTESAREAKELITEAIGEVTPGYLTPNNHHNY